MQVARKKKRETVYVPMADESLESRQVDVRDEEVGARQHLPECGVPTSIFLR